MITSDFITALRGERLHNFRGVALPLFTLPLGFDRWTPEFNIYGSGVGGYSTDFNPTSVKPTPINTYDVNSTTGNDTTGDGSSGAPYKSVDKAITIGNATGTAYQVNLKSRVYNLATNNKGTDPTVDIIINGDIDGGGVPLMTQAIDGLTWTLVSGTVWKADITGSTVQTVVDISSASEVRSGEYLVDGTTPLPVKYETAASVAAVEANPSSYWIDGTDINLKTEDGREPDADILVTTDANMFLYTGNFTTYWEGFEVWGDIPIYLNPSVKNANEIFVGVDCAARFAGQNINGFRIGAIAACYLIRAHATDCIDGDGVGYNSDATATVRATNALEVDCIVRRCGTATNDNASTSHSGANVIRINGIYESTTGPVIADVLGAYSLNVGCFADDTTGSAAAAYSVGTNDAVWGDAKMFTKDCESGSINSDRDRNQSTGGDFFDMGGFIGGIGVDGGTITEI